MIDYVVRFFLTCVFWVFFVFVFIPFVFIPIFPDFDVSLSENVETIFWFALFLIPLIAGWFLSGKLVKSVIYDHFLTEIIYTPNNAQLKFILVPTFVISITSFLYSNFYSSNGFDNSIGQLLFGSLLYGFVSLKFWFLGGILGANSPYYKDKMRLNLSALWAIIAPFSVSLAILDEQYTVGIAQLTAMLLVRLVFFFKALSNIKSAA